MFKSTLEENKNSLIVIEQVLEASMNLTSDSQTKLSLAHRINKLQTAQHILLNNEHLTKLDVYKPLMREHQRLTDVLHSNCVAAWGKKIVWSENDKESQDSWRVILKISGCPDDICDTVFALRHFDSLNIEVKKFSDKLINLIVKPIIDQNLQVDVVKFVNVSTLTLKVSNTEDEFLSAIIKKLKDVFEFLNSTLPADINEIKIMSYLGSYASQQFCKHFKDIVIFNAIPVKYHKLNNFREELIEVREFNEYLSELGNKIIYFILYYKKYPCITC